MQFQDGSHADSFLGLVVKMSRVEVVLLIVVTLILGFWGGVPFYHPDSLLQNMLEALQHRGHPQHFNYPGLTTYVMAVVYKITAWTMAGLGLVPHSIDFFQLWHPYLNSQGSVNFCIPGHVVIVSFAVLGVLATYGIACHLMRSRSAGFVAGLVLCTSFLWVQNSHFLTVDIPMSALVAVTVWATMAFGSEMVMSREVAIVLGVLVGLATSAKYNGGLVGIVPLVAALSGAGDFRMKVKCLFALGAVALVVFGLTNPYIFLDARHFIADIFFEMRHASKGHVGFQADHAWLFHLRNTFMASLGLPGLVLSLSGMLALAVSKRFSLPNRLIILAFPLAFYLLMGMSRLTFQRYMLPIFPFLAVCFAFVFDAFARTIARKAGSRFGTLLKGSLWGVVIIVILPNVQHSLTHNQLLRMGDTRASLERLMRNTNRHPGPLTVAAGGSTAVVLHSMDFLKLLDLGDAGSNSDIVIMDSFSHDRYALDSKLAHEKMPVLRKAACLIILSPYVRAKDGIPYSPQSLYSPFLPDLADRLAPGPYIEVYVFNPEVAELLLTSVVRLNMPMTLEKPSAGFYSRVFDRGNDIKCGGESQDLRCPRRSESVTQHRRQCRSGSMPAPHGA